MSPLTPLLLQEFSDLTLSSFLTGYLLMQDVQHAYRPSFARSGLKSEATRGRTLSVCKRGQPLTWDIIFVMFSYFCG